MLTGEKTRREATKKKMGMERKKPQNRSNQREPESVFSIGLVEMATAFRSLWMVPVMGLL